MFWSCLAITEKALRNTREELNPNPCRHFGFDFDINKMQTLKESKSATDKSAEEKTCQLDSLCQICAPRQTNLSIPICALSDSRFWLHMKGGASVYIACGLLMMLSQSYRIQASQNMRNTEHRRGRMLSNTALCVMPGLSITSCVFVST